MQYCSLVLNIVLRMFLVLFNNIYLLLSFFEAVSKRDLGTYDGENNDECEEKAHEIVQSIVQEMVNIVVGGIVLEDLSCQLVYIQLDINSP